MKNQLKITKKSNKMNMKTIQFRTENPTICVFDFFTKLEKKVGVQSNIALTLFREILVILLKMDKKSPVWITFEISRKLSVQIIF